MTAPKPRTLTHPSSSQTIEVDRDHLDAYLSQGWVEEPPKATKKSTED